MSYVELALSKWRPDGLLIGSDPLFNTERRNLWPWQRTIRSLRRIFSEITSNPAA